jgi:hypothetical protein
MQRVVLTPSACHVLGVLYAAYLLIKPAEVHNVLLTVRSQRNNTACTADPVRLSRINHPVRSRSSRWPPWPRCELPLEAARIADVALSLVPGIFPRTGRNGYKGEGGEELQSQAYGFGLENSETRVGVRLCMLDELRTLDGIAAIDASWA